MDFKRIQFTSDLLPADILGYNYIKDNKQIFQKGPIFSNVVLADEFLPIKSEAKYVAEVKTFKNFVINIPSDININDYNTVVIWCESFEEFITAAKYQ